MRRQDHETGFTIVVALCLFLSGALSGCRSVVNEADPVATLAVVNHPSDFQDDAGARLFAELVADPRETRALWSHAGEKAVSKRDIDELVATIDGAHLNVILLLVYHQGTAFFEPSHARFPEDDDRLPNQSPFEEEGYNDGLSYLLAIRDERRADDDPFNDFEVHAWFTVSEGGDWTGDKKPRGDNTQPYMLHALHPEFKIKYGEYYLREDERYVNHRYSVVHQPRFRAYMADLIAGLVEDYDVDGVHLDYIRAMSICYNDEPLDYPGTDYDFPGCQADYETWTQATFGRAYTLWQDTDRRGSIRDGRSGRIAAWQERAMGLLVKRIHDEVKAVRPGVIISAAVGMTDPEMRNESIQGQAAWEWLDQGWIDAAFVMAYSSDTQAVVDKNRSFINACQTLVCRVRVFPGLATYTIENAEDEWSDLIVEQVNAVMFGQWEGHSLDPPTKGVALFRDGHLNLTAIEALARGPFQEPALPFWGR